MANKNAFLSALENGAKGTQNDAPVVEAQPEVSDRLQAIIALLDDDDADYLLRIMETEVEATPKKASKKAKKQAKAQAEADDTPKLPGTRVPKDRLLDKMPAVKDMVGARMTILNDNEVELIYFTRRPDNYRNRYVTSVTPEDATRIMSGLDKQFGNSNAKNSKAGLLVTNWWK